MAEEKATEKKKPGPKPELFKVPLGFEDALGAAIKTPPPSKADTTSKRK